jgi:hypothetical protein
MTYNDEQISQYLPTSVSLPLPRRWKRIANRWRLQTVAEAFIVEQHGPLRLQPGRMLLVPVVDEIGSVHGKKLLASSWLLLTEMGSKSHVSSTERFGN